MPFCCRYIDRLHNIVRDFGARFSDIDAIYRRVLNDERLPTMQPKWWKSLWARFWRRYTTDARKVMRFMAALDENQVIDIASGALGASSATHREFQKRHGLGHAYAANEQRGASALNSAGVVHSAHSSDDLQMSIDPSSLLFPSTHIQPPLAQIQSLDISANALGLPFVGNTKGSNRRLSQSQHAQSSQDNRTELQEVVVHGLQSSADLNRADEHLKRVVAGQNPADEFQVSVPNPATRVNPEPTSIETPVIGTSKMIGALAPESKGSSVVKLSIIAARRHAGSMLVDCTMGRDLPRDRPIDEEVDKLKTIVQGTDGAISRTSTCVAVPPPRSRSASRMRPTNGFHAMNGLGELPSASSKNGGQVTATTSLSPRELSSSLHQHHSSRPPPRFQTQDSSSFAPPPVARSEEKAGGSILLNADAADTSTMADAGACRRPSCEVQKQAPHTAKSRLHSRVMPDAVSNGVGVSFASLGAAREAAVRQAHIGATAAAGSFQSSACVARPSLLLDATNQGAKAAPAEQSSKKRPSRLSVRQPPKSWDDKVKSLTDKFGDKFEEC
jgi:hypothetical protein